MAIITSGLTCCEMPRITSSDSIPVTPSTPGAMAETLATSSPAISGRFCLICRVTNIFSHTFGPRESGVILRFPSPTTSAVFSPSAPTNSCITFATLWAAAVRSTEFFKETSPTSSVKYFPMGFPSFWAPSSESIYTFVQENPPISSLCMRTPAKAPASSFSSEARSVLIFRIYAPSSLFSYSIGRIMKKIPCIMRASVIVFLLLNSIITIRGEKMANIKSAKKRIKVIAKKSERNQSVRSAYKTQLKKFDAAIAAGDAEAAKALASETVSVVDGAATKGIIHKNKANHKKAQISEKLASLSK